MSDWWDKMSDAQKLAYVQKYPNSKYAAEVQGITPKPKPRPKVVVEEAPKRIRNDE